MNLRAGVATDIGKVREGNEDSYLAEEPLFAVADGMGGHKGGEVASQLALETLEASFGRTTLSLAEQVRDANNAVFARSQRERELSGMGTTLTAVAIDGGEARVAHVGDSRAYLLRAGDLRQLTEDHTLVQRMVRSGEITAAEAEVHPHRSVLTRALGTEPDVTVDEDTIPLVDGDRLLLCSDGLTGMVTEEQIVAILTATPDPQDAATRLVRAANRAGGVDNITVVVLDVEGEVSAASSAEAAPAELRAGVRRTVLRLLLRLGIVVVVLAALLVGLRVYVDRQWYVGESSGRVAVFRGIPASVAGFDLSHPVTVTDIPASNAEALTLYAGLADGITANDEASAESIVAQIRADIAAAQASDHPGGANAGSGGTGGTGTTGGAGGGTG
jgi:protein phosphatase